MFLCNGRGLSNSLYISAIVFYADDNVKNQSVCSFMPGFKERKYVFFSVVFTNIMVGLGLSVVKLQ